jgi:hypothetical protein
VSARVTSATSARPASTQAASATSLRLSSTFLPLQTLQGGNSNGPSLGSNNLVSLFHDTVAQVQDTVSIVHGKHNINLGYQYYNYRTNNYRTNVLYAGNSGLARKFVYDGSFDGSFTAIQRSALEASLQAAWQKQISC